VVSTLRAKQSEKKTQRNDSMLKIKKNNSRSPNYDAVRADKYFTAPRGWSWEPDRTNLKNEVLGDVRYMQDPWHGLEYVEKGLAERGSQLTLETLVEEARGPESESTPELLQITMEKHEPMLE
jgi:hypothetical protein